MTDTALALRPDVLMEEFGSLPAPVAYQEKPPEVRHAYKESALRFRQALKAAEAGVEQEHGPAIAEKFAEHKRLCAAKRMALAPLEELLDKVGGLLIAYDDADLRIAAEEQQRYAAEEAAAQEAVDDAIARGDVEAALAVPVVPPQSPSSVRTQGLHYRETWHVEITDMLTLLRHIVTENPGLTHLVQGNDTALNRYAAGLKGAVKLPGTRVRVTKTPVTPR